MAETVFRNDIVRSARNLLEHAIRVDPNAPYARFGESAYSRTDLRSEVDRMKRKLGDSGIAETSRVAIGLDSTFAHVCLIFALLEIGALWIPINPALKKRSLEHVLADSGVTHVLYAEGFEPSHLSAVARSYGGETETDSPSFECDLDPRLSLVSISHPAPSAPIEPHVCALMYTSGTTGPPKGVQVTGTMLYMASRAVVQVFGAAKGTVAYVWEPLNHIGGAQMIFVPLLSDVTLSFGPRFRASTFWDDVDSAGGTHVHYLGGILQMLLRQPTSRLDRDHKVKMLWGGGASAAVWRECVDRFGVAMCECYGMTETSSIVTMNSSSPDDGVGRVLPWFEVTLRELSEEESGRGEILVRGRAPGLITPGYLGQADSAYDDSKWWSTGDIGEFQGNHSLAFHGRNNDSVRVRGENVSSWEVESTVLLHEDVEQSAVVGVPAAVGEQDMLLHVLLRPDADISESDLHRWLGERLAKFQVPRYIRIVPTLPLTPSQRVAKGLIDKDLSHVFDARHSN